MSQTYCKNCGAPIPSGQRGLCSMCVGEVDHGKDGYYRREIERDDRRRESEEEPPDGFYQ
jgi:predicted amidophosphoribosyltransferase